MKIWTVEEYLQFSRAIRDDSLANICFELLFWTGMTSGELMALSWNDIDLEYGRISITKAIRCKSGEQKICKFDKNSYAFRVVTLPGKVVRELISYKNEIPTGKETIQELIDGKHVAFHITGNYLRKKLVSGCKTAGMPAIRVSDLRYSHIFLLCWMYFSVGDIAERLGISEISVVRQYSGFFSSEREKIAETLEEFRAYVMLHPQK